MRGLPSSSFLQVAALLSLASGCTPEFEDDVALVTRARILAVQVEPPEIAGGGTTRVRALYADGTQALGGESLVHTLCSTRKPLAELGSVAPLCTRFTNDGKTIVASGTLESEVRLPSNTCGLYGPLTTTDPVTKQPTRPVDPDPTGGYYHPAVVFDATNQAATVAPIRLNCALPGVRPQVAQDWNRRSRRNANPIVDDLIVVRENGDELIAARQSDAAPTVLRPGERVTLRVAFAACPRPGEEVCGDGVCSHDEFASGSGDGVCPADCAPMRGCGGAETFLALDPETRSLEYRIESLSVAWFNTAGKFDNARSGQSADTSGELTEIDNGFVAPSEAGEYLIWTVLRDDRGGVGYEGFRFRIDP